MIILLILTINAIHFAFSEVKSYFKMNLLVLLVMSALAVWNGFIMFWDTDLLAKSIQNTFKNVSDFQPKMTIRYGLCSYRIKDQDELKCDSDLWISAVWIEISLIFYCFILFIFFIHKGFAHLCQCCSYCWNCRCCHCCTNEHDQKDKQAEQTEPFNPLNQSRGPLMSSMQNDNDEIGK